MRSVILLLTLLAAPSLAQQAPRDGDVLLSKDELTALVSGKMLEFFTGGFARHGTDGGYDYRYAIDGAPAPGRYEVRDDSTICITFHNGFDRCDLLVKSGERYVMVIKNGDRYPVKAITSLE
ncbi:hypothetical protein AIOL_000708 [Candidatus Rhodobacter oscarellae]|uniref:Uncharacterized protein n=1 Tax=Candidatus Rhodobacter oscarellae TaxID=1675527 RepID=A0A0J9ECY8_9RHOB|nr:hypothetical protein [Candidatus Rhodobacter lobularis]KMW60546.1 hypothetical protein AIOL_000708 [Candidatus Rhodobacter lobularis]